MFRAFIDIIAHAKLELPALELIILVGLLALCLVLRFTRLGLIAAFALTYRWGWQFMREQGGTDNFMIYLIFGVIVGTLALISLFSRAPRE